MLEMRGLRQLHRLMRQRGLEKVIIPYQVRTARFSVFFTTTGSPYELSITARAANIFVLFEVYPGYRIEPVINDEAVYRALARLLRHNGQAGNKLIPQVFLAELDTFLGNYHGIGREPTPAEILAVRHDLPDRELPYFWHWRDNDARGQHVTGKNLTKTRLVLGTQAEQHSRRHNLSSIWTDDPDKGRDWQL